jgi:hypothetical protein
MRDHNPWIHRILLLCLIIGIGITCRRRPTGDGLVPSIGGDTWPPVPVKDARPA